MSTLAPRNAQRGVVLISSMLLLLVVTILAVSMFRGFGIEQKIAGNIRDKERALHAAESAQQYAEWWLSSGLATGPINCTAAQNANTGAPQICTNTLNSLDPTNPTSTGNVVNVPTPWATGITYQPVDPVTGQPIVVASGGGINVYAGAPQFYISYLGTYTPTAFVTETVYQIDALGYGGSSGSVAIVESVYQVGSSSHNLGSPDGA